MSGKNEIGGQVGKGRIVDHIPCKAPTRPSCETDHSCTDGMMLTSQPFVAAREHHREAVRVGGLTSFAKLLYLTRAQKAENRRERPPDVHGFRVLYLSHKAVRASRSK